MTAARPGPPRRLRTVVGLCAALLVVLAAGTGCAAGGSMRLAWDTPADSGAREYGNGAWLVGDTLVRSRYDAVTGFDAGSGKRRWEYVPPGSDTVCAVSRAADGGGDADHPVLLIAYGVAGEPGGCTTVVALDLADGRALWHTRRTPDALADVTADLVATGGGLAVLRDNGSDRALRALDPRTGAPRWKAALPWECAPQRVAVSGRQVLAVLACRGTGLRLAAFDRADGRERWNRPLGDASPLGTDPQVLFLSADPLVVQLGGTAYGTPGAYLAFAEDGRALARIESTGAHGTIATGKPARVAVADGRLYALAEGKHGKGYQDRVLAFDLTSGRELWREYVASSSRLLALDVRGGRVTALADRGTRNGGHEQLHVYAAADGDEQESRDVDADLDRETGELAGLFTHDDRVIVVRWGLATQPFTAYERR